MLALWLSLPSALHGQTNFNFNNGDASILPPASAPYAGWEYWLPEFYGAFDPVSGLYTNGMQLPSVTFATNNVSAGNLGLFLHAGTTNSSQFLPPRVGSFFTNAPSLTNFTLTGEFYNWTNGQSQEFGLAGRVLLPLAPNNAPNEESLTNSDTPGCLTLVYANARSAKAFYSPPESGSSDNLRIYWWFPTNNGGNVRLESGSFSGPTNGMSSPAYITGTSLSPNNAGGHYRMILTANGGYITGQLVDLSTGLPMVMGNGTNILRRSIEEGIAQNPSNAAWQAMTNYVNVGGAFGPIAFIGSSGASAAVPGNPTRGNPLDPKFDNVAIVPGVVTLESATTVTGPYTVDTTGGIEVYPKRITVPVRGDTRFYRINWILSDHIPTITSISPGPTVNVVLTTGATTTVTNTVGTMVLTYN